MVKFSLLHQLIMCDVFGRFKDLAKLLLILSNPASYQYYPPAFQLAVDMLFKLGEYDEMVDAMLNRKMVFEALHILQNYPCPNLNIKKLLSVAERS